MLPHISVIHGPVPIVQACIRTNPLTWLYIQGLVLVQCTHSILISHCYLTKILVHLISGVLLLLVFIITKAVNAQPIKLYVSLHSSLMSLLFYNDLLFNCYINFSL